MNEFSKARGTRHPSARCWLSTASGWPARSPPGQESLALIDAKLAFYDTWAATGKRPASEPTVRGPAAATSPSPGPAAHSKSKPTTLRGG